MKPAVKIANSTPAEISRGDVFTPKQNFSIGRDPDLYSLDRLPHRAPARIEWMVEGCDGRSLRESIALDHDIPELAPEFLERGLERRGADDEAPELPAEAPVYAPVLPPFPVPRAVSRRSAGFRYRQQDVIAQQF